MALSNAADKSKEKQSEAQLQREKLNGNKKVANAEYDDEKAAYTLMVLLSPALDDYAEILPLPHVSSRRPVRTMRVNLGPDAASPCFCFPCADPTVREGDLCHHHDQDQDQRALRAGSS